MFPTPTFEETATFEPAPFADLFGDPDDLFDAVRLCSAAWFSRITSEGKPL